MIYLDNAATTKVDKRIVRDMEKYHLKEYGNASSLHVKGREAKRAIEKARKIIAKSIKAKSEEIVFTSGGTEANNLALKGLYFANPEKNHIIISKIEHDCVLNAARWLEKQGAKITYLDVDKDGFVDIKQLKKQIRKNTLLVSIIHGNNEIGTIQDIEKIGKLCKEKNVYFHTDACQSYTKTKIDVKKQNLDLVTLNAHKIHGPKGVGALYIRKGVKITPLLHGGGHEYGIRSGTENVPGIMGMAYAVKLAKEKYIKQMEKLRNRLIIGIEEIENVVLNGPKENRLCNNINFAFNNIEGEAIGGYLDSYGIASSTGSACSNLSEGTSHVLKEIGLSDIKANSSIRLSLSRETTEKEIDKTIKILKKVVKRLRMISPIK